MNRAERQVARFAAFRPEVTRAGRKFAMGKVHLAVGSRTICGLRRGTVSANPAEVSDDRCCDKCFPTT
jgi:hypothetical protein